MAKRKTPEDDERVENGAVDDSEVEEGKPAMKLVKAVTAAMGNGSTASSSLPEQVEEEGAADDKHVDRIDVDEVDDEEGKPVKKLVNAVEAAMGNGNNAPALSEEQVEEDYDEDDDRFEDEGDMDAGDFEDDGDDDDDRGDEADDDREQALANLLENLKKIQKKDERAGDDEDADVDDDEDEDEPAR